MRFSTVLCTGLERTGKTSFCNLLMEKTVLSTPPGNFHTIFIKRSTKKTENKWTEINSEKLDKLINELSRCKQNPDPCEIWDVLLLLDIAVSTPTSCLLQRSVVTFVTYKMLGEYFESDSNEFMKKHFSKFLKEFLSSSCAEIKNNSEFSKLRKKKRFHISFVGIHNGTCSEESYANEAEVVNESIGILKEHINCPNGEFTLPIWDINNQYLHLVNLKEQKGEHFKNIKTNLENIIANNSIHEVPLSWMLLYLKIQKFCIENGTNYVECDVVREKLWKKECCGFDENDLIYVLNFFHNLDALFYYDSVEGVKNFVFTDCHWIFASLKHLYKHKDKIHYDSIAKLSLKYDGELLSSIIEDIKIDPLGKVEFKYFLELLKHLKFIAPVSKNNYFMPSILDSHESYKTAHYGIQIFESLSITFSTGSLHRSVFCLLAAYMIDKSPPNWSHLKYHERTKRRHTFKDLITFSVIINGYECYVCIVDKIFFLEIQIYSKSSGVCPADLHCIVLEFIKNSLKAVCGDGYKLGFLCHKCEGQPKQHLTVVTEFHGSSITVCCSKTGHLEVLKENSYTRWFPPKVCYNH